MVASSLDSGLVPKLFGSVALPRYLTWAFLTNREGDPSLPARQHEGLTSNVSRGPIISCLISVPLRTHQQVPTGPQMSAISWREASQGQDSNSCNGAPMAAFKLSSLSSEQSGPL